jgi:threonine/homoserine/homoserine lactone efflux protein
MENFFKGLAIGFCIAAPVGPVNLLCIRRSMTDGRLVGLISGLGAATADATYGMVAAFGLGAVTSVLLAHRTAIQLLGGIFLVFIGVRILRQRSEPAMGRDHARSLPSAYASTLALTLANPTTILSFLGIFAGVGIDLDTTGALSAVALIAGVFLGSGVWWVILSTSAHWLAGRANAGHLRLINQASAILILGFGIFQLGRLAIAAF